MILVVGGTGRLGTALVQRLTSRGLPVRVMTRDPSRAAHLRGPQVQVVVGDLRTPDSVRSAVSGAEQVVAAAHGLVGPRGVSPTTVDRDGNASLVDAAEAVGAKVVLLSVVGAAPDSEMELFRMKHAAEEHLGGSGVPGTIVRATAYAELWIDLMRLTARRGGRPLVFGTGRNPVNFVSVRDVAALVDLVLFDDATRGLVLELGGPEDLTLDQLAVRVQRADGRSAPPRHLRPALLRLLRATAGHLQPALARQVAAALVMDQADLRFDSQPVRKRFPALPCTTVADLLT